MVFWRKYGTATAAGTHLRVPIVKAGSNDFAGSGDWTPAAGDVKLSKDGGSQANIGTLPSYSNGAWEFQLALAELQCKQLEIMVVDSATKAVEDQCILVETFGNASAMYQWNPQDVVRLGLTALPNAAADAAGGLPISDAGGLDLDAIKAKTDALPSGFAKNVALSNFSFLMVDSTDHVTPKTGLTVTAQISKDGGAFAGCTNSVSEISNGVYKINLTQTEMNADIVTLKFTGSGADQTTIVLKTDA